jgi:hypothetical protein
LHFIQWVLHFPEEYPFVATHLVEEEEEEEEEENTADKSSSELNQQEFFRIW